MMLVLGLDFEATGLDTSEARIIEIGAVVWDTDEKLPLLLHSQLVKPGVPIPAEVTKLTGITEGHLAQYGVSIQDALEQLNYICIKANPKYIVAHNGEGYDRPLLWAEAKRNHKDLPNVKDIPWIDTRCDLPFDNEPESRRLKHLALDINIINYFAHRAIFDVMVMLKVMAQFPMEKIEEYQKIPFVDMRALVSYDDRQKAKDLRFVWEQLGDKKYEKSWVKRVKEHLIPIEIIAAEKIGVKLVRL